MDRLESLIFRSISGNTDAYGLLVSRFQDMAVGYSYSIVGDFQLAEDAAQEAFFEAYRTLSTLREPAAFPGWFRRIVFKQCDRITRGRRLRVVEMDDAKELESCELGPSDVAEKLEMKDRLWAAIDSLPDHERTAMMLYYISGYSQVEVAGFLDVPVTTIKKRLHSGRNRLREMLVDLVVDGMRERRPSRNDVFASDVVEILKAAKRGDAVKVKELLERDPRLSAARDPMGNTALIIAVNSGHSEIAELLLSAGVRPVIRGRGHWQNRFGF